jgi:uncharacterized membrane protein
MARRISEKTGLPFSKRNWRFFFLGLGVILIGYIFLSIPPAQGVFSLTLAPILLVVGYCVIIPVAILLRGHREAGVKESRNRPERQ